MQNKYKRNVKGIIFSVSIRSQTDSLTHDVSCSSVSYVKRIVHAKQLRKNQIVICARYGLCNVQLYLRMY